MLFQQSSLIEKMPSIIFSLFQYPKDVWKVSPTLIISALPFANYVIFPIA